LSPKAYPTAGGRSKTISTCGRFHTNRHEARETGIEEKKIKKEDPRGGTGLAVEGEFFLDPDFERRGKWERGEIGYLGSF
jgi:hypothetical protein